jgi:hypothetical protein
VVFTTTVAAGGFASAFFRGVTQTATVIAVQWIGNIKFHPAGAIAYTDCLRESTT